VSAPLRQRGGINDFGRLEASAQDSEQDCSADHEQHPSHREPEVSAPNIIELLSIPFHNGLLSARSFRAEVAPSPGLIERDAVVPGENWLAVRLGITRTSLGRLRFCRPVFPAHLPQGYAFKRSEATA
jgi:hypothetical protein